jgi:hypothetical protein
MEVMWQPQFVETGYKLISARSKNKNQQESLKKFRYAMTKDEKTFWYLGKR